ncbi:MAG: glycosyltransferase family 4 protein [Bryobacteraceae bacterium]
MVESEVALLRQNGVEVRELVVDNDRGPDDSLLDLAKIGWNSAWSSESHKLVADACGEFQPDVAHVHNFWLRWSPSVHRACQSQGVPTVQTLHNFRLFCLNGLYKADGEVCLECSGKTPWRGVVNRCYRDSFIASMAVARMIVVNRMRGTWDKDVDTFIALSEHSRQMYIDGGLPEDRVVVKGNFVEDSGTVESGPSKSTEILFAGRLAPEKGAEVLLEAWAHGGFSSRARLTIIGDGPLGAQLKNRAKELGLDELRVQFLGQRPVGEVRARMSQARAVVIPSLFFECFPRTLVEAFSLGRPVIASNIGALSELVTEDVGMMFPAKNAPALAQAIGRLLDKPDHADRLGRQARELYASKYTPELAFHALRGIYQQTIEKKRGAMVRKPAFSAACL